MRSVFLMIGVAAVTTVSLFAVFSFTGGSNPPVDAIERLKHLNPKAESADEENRPHIP